jgi:hypothetical protein
MFRSTPAVFLAPLCLVAMSLAPRAAPAAPAAKAPQMLQLPAGARVGVINLLDPEVTHFHASRQIENSFLKTYTVSWQVSAMLLAVVRDRLTQLGLTAVPVGPSDELRRGRESCFLDAALAKGLPKECGPLYAQLAAAERLSAIIVLGPGRNDSNHAGGARHRELPEYMRGWCFVTGAGGAEALPSLLNLSELLLIGVSAAGAQLIDRQWGGDGQSWTGYQAPPDLKAFPQPQLDQLQPLFAALLKRQAAALLEKLQVVR